MLEGDGGGDMFGAGARPRAGLLVAFRGGKGTADCTAAALERGIPVEWIPHSRFGQARPEPRQPHEHSSSTGAGSGPGSTLGVLTTTRRYWPLCARSKRMPS